MRGWKPASDDAGRTMDRVNLDPEHIVDLIKRLIEIHRK
jgi:hypothetical protein